LGYAVEHGANLAFRVAKFGLKREEPIELEHV